MYCKYAEFACKLQTNLSMNNKQCHDMQKNMQHRIVKCKFKFAEFAGICQKIMFMISKKQSIKNDRICRTNAISSSADPRTPRLLTSNMYVHVHICNIYSAYMCICCFRRLPSCLINISLSWGIPWENPRQAF